MRESRYQGELIKKIKRMFPDSIVLKNDPTYIQGIPDLIILYRDRWAALEVKASEDADERPNQRYYIERMKKASYAAFIFPENEEEVLRALQHALSAERQTRVSKSK